MALGQVFEEHELSPGKLDHLAGSVGGAIQCVDLQVANGYLWTLVSVSAPA
jgi:hypothetical protein